jgi:hypothetical protein
MVERLERSLSGRRAFSVFLTTDKFGCSQVGARVQAPAVMVQLGQGTERARAAAVASTVRGVYT